MNHRLLPTQGRIVNSYQGVTHTLFSQSKTRQPSLIRKSNASSLSFTSSQASAVEAEDHNRGRQPQLPAEKFPISRVAREKEANKEFFVNLLTSAATKRDAKAYISRIRNPAKTKEGVKIVRRARPQVNLGGLFGRARAVEESPVFSQYEPEQKVFEEVEILHVALIKLTDLHQLPENVMFGIAETLCQLTRLGMSPCIVLEALQDGGGQSRRQLNLQAERLGGMIDAMNSGARMIEDIFAIDGSGQPELSLRNLLLQPLRRGLIPIILPTAYSKEHQRIVSIKADDAVLALTTAYANVDETRRQSESQQFGKQVSLDRIIVIDYAGGIPSPNSADGKHVFLNLEQEYGPVSQQLVKSEKDTSQRHLSNLVMLRKALQILPASASGLMVTPEEAANLTQLKPERSLAYVGTRRQKNTLIYNLLTDKPAYSSSLPKTRLSKSTGTTSLPSVATFVKHGMALKIFPDPMAEAWTPNCPRIKLTDPQIDLDRLVHLIDDSFNRNLDVGNYLKRVNDRIAGVIIAGDYEGGAILTWETPPGVDVDNADRLVPYLDKFAVLKKAQGAGGVADILFNAMVRTCFPEGVCWRSRKNNPVNKWYFERSRGTRKIPDMNWTMFWTTPGVAEDSQRFSDYEGVCRGVEPTWLDKKLAAD